MVTDSTTLKNATARHNEPAGAEAAAHSLLSLVATYPGAMGRLRAARFVGGYPVPCREDEDPKAFAKYAVDIDWPLREITRLIDSLINGALIAQTAGPRPVLVLTRAGFRALEALDGIRHDAA